MADRQASPGTRAFLSRSCSRTLARQPRRLLRAASLTALHAPLCSATGTLVFTQAGLLAGTSWSVTVGTAQGNPTSGTSLPAVESRLPLPVETDR